MPESSSTAAIRLRVESEPGFVFPDLPSKMPPNVLAIDFHELNDVSLNKATLKPHLPSHVTIELK